MWENLEQKPRTPQAAVAYRLGGDAPREAWQGSLAPEDSVLKGSGRDAVLAKSSAFSKNLLVPLARNSSVGPSLAGAEVAGSSPPSCPIH